MKKAQKRFYGTALTLSTVASVVAPVAVSAATVTYAEAEAKVNAAVATPVFSLYNKAYEAILALPKDQQGKLLDKLAPVWDKAATPYVTGILAKLEALAKDKNLKLYHELLAEIEKGADSKEALNKEYLLGQLTEWGASGTVYGKTEQAAINAVVKAWDLTPESVAAAKEAIAKVTNASSVEWLNAQLNEALAKAKTTITKFQATGEKTLQVTFGKAVADTTKMVLTLKRDGATASVSKTEWNTDKTVATLTLASSIVEADYQVVAKYDTEAEVSSPVLSLEESKPTKIEIISSKLTIKEVDDTYNGTTKKRDDAATFKIRITNQYGEDITDKVDDSDLRIRASRGDDSVNIGDNGLITITGDTADGDDEFNVGEAVSVTVTYRPDALIATKTLTVAEAADVASIEIGELTAKNSSSKERVTPKANLESDYYLPITVKDADGNVLTKDELIDALDRASSSDDDVVDVKEDADQFIGELNSKPIIKLIDGNESGKAVITVTAKNGVTATKTVTVEAAVGIDKLSFNAPDVTVKKGSDFVLTFNAYDQYGNQLVKESDFPSYYLADFEGSKATTLVFLDDEGDKGTEIEVENGYISYQVDYANNSALQLVITPDATADKDDKVTVSVDTVTGKSSEISFSIKDEAYVASIATDSIIKRAATASTTSGAVAATVGMEVKRSNISFKDQYGDTIILEGYSFVDTTAGLNKYELIKADSKYGIVMEVLDPASFKVVSASNGTDPKIKFESKKVTASGEVKVSVVEYKQDENVAGVEHAAIVKTLDTMPITLQSYDLAKIEGVTMDNFDKIYVGDTFFNKYGSIVTDYSKKKEVLGLFNGNKVSLPSGYVTLSAASAKSGIQATIDGNNVKLNATTAGAIDTDGADETSKVNVVVGVAGKVYNVTKDFTYSDKAPEVTTFQVKDEYGTVLSNTNFTFDIANIETEFRNKDVDTKDADAAIRFYTKDSYGLDVNGAEISVASKNDADKDGSLSVTIDQASGELRISGEEAGDSFTLSAITGNGQVKTVTITLR